MIFNKNIGEFKIGRSEGINLMLKIVSYTWRVFGILKAANLILDQ